MDCLHDEEMKRLKNWLLHGLSACDIDGSGPNYSYDETMLVISKDSFQAYTNSSGFKELSNLTTLVPNCNIYCITKPDEEDTEKAEVIKVAQFYEMVHDKQVIGLPARELRKDDYRLDSEVQMVEKWPIIQAYGLDLVGNGFFTLKHKFTNLRGQLNKIYEQYDSFGTFRLVHDDVERLGQHFFDNFF